MTTKKKEPVDGTVEEWIPKTAHEVAVGMFHGLPNILVPARHHLAKVPGAEAKTALKAVNRALDMVTECTAKLAKVPGPVRANFKDGKTFVIVETDTNRVTADGDTPEFRQITLLHRRNSDQAWKASRSWNFLGWSPTCDEFAAIIDVIAKVTAGMELPADGTPGEPQ